MKNEKKIVILYGSQTGTAEEYAENIWRQSRIRGFSGPVMPMDDFNIANLVKEEFVIFVCSTTGLGEEPDNMKKSWKFLLRKSLPTNSLGNLKFCVLGLGDSSYSKFNYPAKKLSKRLLQLGANQLIDIGLCDYQHDLGHDAVADPWTESLWASLGQYFLIDSIDKKEAVSVFVPRWNIKRKTGIESNITTSSLTDLRFSTNEDYSQYSEKPYLTKVKSNIRTTAETHFQDVRLLKFSSPDCDFDYEPGDVFNLRPRNSKEKIDSFFALFKNHSMNLKPNDVIEISQIHSDMPLPYFFQKPIPLYQIVEQYWDLSSIPRKYAFSVLAHISEDKLEKEKCIEFCSSEGQEDYLNYCNRPRRNILEVLEDFHHSTAKLTLESLFELLPAIKPRAFSIANSSKASNNKEVEILVAVVKYYTKLKKERLGLCSNWLKDLQIGSEVFGWIKKGTFIFPKDEMAPLVMIGPGTGLAPFRSYILERDYLQNASKDTLILFFGCRNEKGDFHSGEYLKQLHSEGKINLICAFSRDQEDKIYVQHKIDEHSKLLWQLASQENCTIMIAGNSKNMPGNVKDSFVENVFVREGNMSLDEAKNFLSNLESTSRLQLETW